MELHTRLIPIFHIRVNIIQKMDLSLVHLKMGLKMVNGELK